MAGMDAVWDVLTAYEKLQDVVPSLVKNEVVERTADGGARLAQVGGAKVLPGVTFTAKTILDVRVYREDNPLPESMLAEHLPDNAPSKAVREYDMALPLRRGIFPRPFSYTTLPHRDITMQNVLGEGDFEHYQVINSLRKINIKNNNKRNQLPTDPFHLAPLAYVSSAHRLYPDLPHHYQGVWRMQSLPNCNPNGEGTWSLLLRLTDLPILLIFNASSVPFSSVSGATDVCGGAEAQGNLARPAHRGPHRLGPQGQHGGHQRLR